MQIKLFQIIWNMKNTATTLFILLLTLSFLGAQDSQIIFPRAFAFAVDDMAWNIGNDAGDIDNQGPYRIGIDRNMDIKDYQAVVEVGRAVGVRIQGLFVLAEMDRENILAKYPSTTWQGSEWDNAGNISQEQIDIMNYVKNNAAYLEFGLHGVGHEYWVNGEKKRAEWYCTQDDHPWPEESMKEHIQCFKDIMAQYGLSAENGHSFPESFVPCAYGYYWNPEGEFSTGKLMSESGVKYVNTLFDEIRELNPPEDANGGGFDNGVVVVNRLNYGNEWYALSSVPTVDIAKQETDIIESHWSNWLAQDDFLQKQTNNNWIDYYKMVQATPDRYIAKNTEQFYSQWLYKKYTNVHEDKPGRVELDNSNMPSEYYKYNILGNMVLKVKLNVGEHVSKASLNNEPISCYYEDEGYGYIYLPVLKQENYVFNYELSEKKMPFVVYNDGTYNVYKIADTKKEKTIELRVYGFQEVKIYCPNPQRIESENSNLRIVKSDYNQESGMLSIALSANDIQGETGALKLLY